MDNDELADLLALAREGRRVASLGDWIDALRALDDVIDEMLRLRDEADRNQQKAGETA